ncbi:MAG: hypothetical protein WC091_03240 [Sulfuricellaceae bacterium]
MKKKFGRRWREANGFPQSMAAPDFAGIFLSTGEWNGKHYTIKQIEAYAVEENGWLVITVIVKFF